MTSSKQNFQNLRKVSSQIFVKTIWSKFQQNRSKNVEIKDPDRHTHTHIRTHRQGSSWDNIFSPEMTEYKNIENDFSFTIVCSRFVHLKSCMVFRDCSRSLTVVPGRKMYRTSAVMLLSIKLLDDLAKLTLKQLLIHNRL